MLGKQASNGDVQRKETQIQEVATAVERGKEHERTDCKAGWKPVKNLRSGNRRMKECEEHLCGA